MLEKEDSISIRYIIYIMDRHELLNKSIPDGYDIRNTENYILEKLENRHLKSSVLYFNDFNSIEEALSFINNNRKDLQYLDLTILPKINIPHIYA